VTGVHHYSRVTPRRDVSWPFVVKRSFRRYCYFAANYPSRAFGLLADVNAVCGSGHERQAFGSGRDVRLLRSSIPVLHNQHMAARRVTAALRSPLPTFRDGVAWRNDITGFGRSYVPAAMFAYPLANGLCANLLLRVLAAALRITWYGDWAWRDDCARAASGCNAFSTTPPPHATFILSVSAPLTMAHCRNAAIPLARLTARSDNGSACARKRRVLLLRTTIRFHSAWRMLFVLARGCLSGGSGPSILQACIDFSAVVAFGAAAGLRLCCSLFSL